VDSTKVSNRPFSVNNCWFARLYAGKALSHQIERVGRFFDFALAGLFRDSRFQFSGANFTSRNGNLLNRAAQSVAVNEAHEPGQKNGKKTTNKRFDPVPEKDLPDMIGGDRDKNRGWTQA